MTPAFDAKSIDIDADSRWVRRALGLAERARGRVSPNPPVGAVLVRDGQVVGEGWTAPPGGPHAEIMALRQAGDRAHGATLYVTLEPCAHHGRTPPCAPALVRAGIARAVVAIPDPFAGVNGRGISCLEDAGISVTLGVESDTAISLSVGFLKRVLHGLPAVTVKYAMSLDGRIATRTGHSHWITGAESRREVHRLRDRYDAIVVGIGTVLADDPLLTTRLSPEECGDGGPHHPVRVVLDGHARMPLDAAMLRRDVPGKTLVATTEHAPRSNIARLRAAGADVEVFSKANSRVDLLALLHGLVERGINTVLVEGGATVTGALFDAELVDSVETFVAPVIIGGATAPGPVAGIGHDSMTDATRLSNVEFRRIGSDLMISARIRPLPRLEDLMCLVESSKRSGESPRCLEPRQTTR